MANRTAKLADIILEGPHIREGDWICDSPTNNYTDGIGAVRYTNFSTKFPDVREDATVWIDNDKLGKFCEFRLLNGNEKNPWHISNLTIKPIPNTQCQGVITKNSYGGFLYLIQGLKNLNIIGDNIGFMGIDGITKKNPFLKGKFGFSATSTGIYSGYHVFSLSVLDGGHIYLNGIEGEHPFSVLRLQGGSYDWTVSVTIENCYIHDTESEGGYIGYTHAEPGAKINNLKISKCIFARTGSEAIQMQHLVGNAHVSNVTCFGSDAGYLSQFQPGQDTCIQNNPNEGNIIIENIIVDGAASHGMNCFGSPHVSDTKNTTVRNILFSNIRGEAVYFHPSCVGGMNWNFDNIYIRKPNREYYIKSKTVSPNWLISAINGTDKVTFGKVIHDGSYPSVYQNTKNMTVGDVVLQDLPEVQYVNNGFYEPSNRIKFYRQYMAKYITGVDNIPVDYKAGDIVIDREPGFLPEFTKCIEDNTATDIRPKQAPDKYMILMWDKRGVRNDQPTWQSDSIQKPYPPDDLRVKRDSYWAELNIGLVEQVTVDSLLEELNEQIELNSMQAEVIIAMQAEIDNHIGEKTSIITDVESAIGKYK